ncbi:MAG: hypothetical protein NC417_07250 [Candidatus Gastranaerophilales bacterium]|nr:hypothetical protein [Candidatus Gastranaerophilales bacterium]
MFHHENAAHFHSGRRKEMLCIFIMEDEKKCCAFSSWKAKRNAAHFHSGRRKEMLRIFILEDERNAMYFLRAGQMN